MRDRKGEREGEREGIKAKRQRQRETDIQIERGKEWKLSHKGRFLRDGYLERENKKDIYETEKRCNRKTGRERNTD